jgi:hypothetical protein|tara:strand:- start:1337 stop:1522 length:186 start_codon:yes stop_codon:yes gene_type:complete
MTTLPDVNQEQLRTLGILNENEVAEKQGDLHIALNVLTQSRRVITIPQAMLENTQRRVLRD